MASIREMKPKQWALDATIAVALLVIGLISQLENSPAQINDLSTRPADWFHITLIFGMSLPLVLRRVYPRTVFLIVLGSWMIDRGLDYPNTLANIGILVGFYTLGVELSKRQSALWGGIASAVIVGWTIWGVFLFDSVNGPEVITTIISTVTPLLIGREMHDRRLRVEELRVRAEQAERDQEEQARRAVADERARIARELHDVVAHQMTVMTIQAEGAKRIASDSDPRVTEALDTISDAGHSALEEMRRMVGLLRTTDSDPEIAPLPKLADVDDLVDQVRAAGVEVDLRVTGEVRPLADGTELSAYRIVQESLTNSVRHGGPDVRASIAIEYSDDALQVSVVDNGRGGASNGSDDNGGHGLVGMRERVAVLGGQFAAGPKPGGGYQVAASIPVKN